MGAGLVILPDINLLVYAYNANAPLHVGARRWWETTLGTSQAVALPWVVSHGFIRVMTHPRVVENPLRPEAAIRHVREWLQQPYV